MISQMSISTTRERKERGKGKDESRHCVVTLVANMYSKLSGSLFKILRPISLLPQVPTSAVMRVFAHPSHTVKVPRCLIDCLPGSPHTSFCTYSTVHTTPCAQAGQRPSRNPSSSSRGYHSHIHYTQHTLWDHRNHCHSTHSMGCPG